MRIVARHMEDMASLARPLRKTLSSALLTQRRYASAESTPFSARH
jgi:hypothetical protein